jgi:hypothetical protein
MAAAAIAEGRTMRTIIASLSALLALAAAGCGGDGGAPEAEPEDEATTVEDAEPAEDSRCLRVSAALKKGIATGLIVEYGGKLGKATAVRSEDFEKVWYVSAVIRGPGLGSDTVGTWATNADPSGPPSGLIIAADAIAREWSDWGAAAEEGSPAAEVRGLENDGAQESRDCLED